MRWANVGAVIGIAAAVAACTQTIDGSATLPAGIDPQADVLLSEDGYGVALGRPFAPVAIDIYIEPQCPHCASFEEAYGDDIADYIADGDLTVTYRPLTFLDERKSNDYSAKVSNALFLAATAGPEADVSAENIQDFVQELYASGKGSGDDESIAVIAEDADLPSDVVDRIANGDTGVDTTAMDESNTQRVKDEAGSVATPTVYDLTAKSVIDTDNENWLKELVDEN